ncbi:MAG TPA: alanine racemase [Actinomycetes bacterium]|nr:alanine racemase [Actinomycetes bacterium]
MSAPARELIIDLDAIAANTAVLAQCSASSGLMAVVKADAYGHGLVPSARAAQAGGATWLGVALLEEALALRAAGVEGPLLAWLLGVDDEWAEAINADIDLSVSAQWVLSAISDAATAAGRTARIHLKVDTGLGRSGAPAGDWAHLVEAARRAESDGSIRVVGVWSHFAYADAPGHPTIDRQIDAFGEAVAVAERAGLRPDVRHLANSAATLTRPDTHFDLTRPGLAVYGLSPLADAPSKSLGLEPAMSLHAPLALVKRVPAGHGVSYMHRYVTNGETTLGLVPLGYADGVPRSATNVGPVLAGGRRRTVAGVVCMDQFVVDFGDDSAAAGDVVTLFGSGAAGEPTAQDWADATGTISYEIVARMGSRVRRRYVGGSAS